ncbi:MAG: VCBS repeat-containing protein [Methylotenera sp.]|nr:VCBS repeat-containing protein [Methylotenera sp.]
MDVNGDGLADIVQLFLSPVGWYAGVPQRRVYLNTGSSFIKSDSYTNSLPDTYITGGSGTNMGTQLMDVNGDGLADIVQLFLSPVGWYAGVPQRRIYLSGIKKENLTTLTPGLGTTTSLTYKPITDNSIYVKGTTGEVGTTTCPQPLGTDGTSNSYPILNTQDAQYVVSTATVSDGNGGVLNNNYSYGGAKVHMTGRGSLGFRYQKVTSVEADTNSITFFRQDYPYIGLPCQSEKTITSTGKVIGTSQLSYANSPMTTGTAISQFPYLSQSVERNFELNAPVNAAPINSTVTTNQYDGFGNATQITVTSGDGEVNAMTNVYTKTTTNTYSNDSTNWLLGRLLRSTVTSTTP